MDECTFHTMHTKILFYKQFHVVCSFIKESVERNIKREKKICNNGTTDGIVLFSCYIHI